MASALAASGSRRPDVGTHLGLRSTGSGRNPVDAHRRARPIGQIGQASASVGSPNRTARTVRRSPAPGSLTTLRRLGQPARRVGQARRAPRRPSRAPAAAARAGHRHARGAWRQAARCRSTRRSRIACGRSVGPSGLQHALADRGAELDLVALLAWRPAPLIVTSAVPGADRGTRPGGTSCRRTGRSAPGERASRRCSPRSGGWRRRVHAGAAARTWAGPAPPLIRCTIAVCSLATYRSSTGTIPTGTGSIPATSPGFGAASRTAISRARARVHGQIRLVRRRRRTPPARYRPAPDAASGSAAAGPYGWQALPPSRWPRRRAVLPLRPPSAACGRSGTRRRRGQSGQIARPRRSAARGPAAAAARPHGRRGRAKPPAAAGCRSCRSCLFRPTGQPSAIPASSLGNRRAQLGLRVAQGCWRSDEVTWRAAFAVDRGRNTR